MYDGLRISFVKWRPAATTALSQVGIELDSTWRCIGASHVGGMEWVQNDTSNCGPLACAAVLAVFDDNFMSLMAGFHL